MIFFMVRPRLSGVGDNFEMITWEGNSKIEKTQYQNPEIGILIAFKDLFPFGLKVRQARRGGEKKAYLMDFQVSNRLLNRL